MFQYSIGVLTKNSHITCDCFCRDKCVLAEEPGMAPWFLRVFRTCAGLHQPTAEVTARGSAVAAMMKWLPPLAA